jgi:hypothetical protein
MTFSQHAAKHRSAIIYYLLLFTLVLPLLLLFFVGWFAPAFHLTSLFSLFVIAAVLLQYSVVIVPEVGGWKTVYHVAGSAISGVFLLLALMTTLFANTIGGLSKFVTLCCVLAMIGILCIGAVNKVKHKNLLIMQAVYYAAFFLAVLFITYEQ